MEKNEYEIQHFGFSADQLSLERRHFINKMLSLALQSMVEKLSTDKPSLKEQLKTEKETVTQSMLKSFEPQLQRVEELDRKNFSIPEYILLASDYGHTKQYSEVDEQQIDAEIVALKRKFLENSVMIAALKAEKAKYKEINEVVQDELKTQAEVEDNIKQTDIQCSKTSKLAQHTISLLKKADS